MNATLAPPHRPAPARPPAAAEPGRRRPAEPRWARPALVALLLLSALAYTWDLSASGYANSFYAAAVQAATKSWKALFFGSLDSSSFITVDKPPASLWVMALSGRLFGFSSASMLVPQALEGVAAVGLLHASVKRWFGAPAGLIAGAVLALTPVAALMFRFNNPDALLVMLLVASAYCLTRALERAGTRWVIAAGTLIGLAFLAKMMQAFLVLPAFAGVYLLAAPTGLRRRLAQVSAGAAAIVLSGGWWVAIVALWPAGSRPFIDGSPDNSILNLILGYNGLGRLFGAAGLGGGGGGGGANFSGPAGLLRLFDAQMGAQASWLLPAALLALGVGLWRTRRASRTDRTRAALLLWGGWLIVSALVFSLGSGVIHTYYTVALAPAIAALVAIGATSLGSGETLSARLLLAAAVAFTAGWAFALLLRTPAWEPWLRVLVPVAAVLAVALLLAAPMLRAFGPRISAATAALALMACLAAPVAYTAQTVTTAHTGSTPSAGPASASSGPGGRGGGTGPTGSLPPGGRFGAGGGPGGAGGPRSTGTALGGGAPPSPRVAGVGSAGRPGGATSGGAAGGGAAGGRGGGIAVGAALERALQTDAARYRWVAAVSGSQSAATIELATGGEPVMAIGGFNGNGGNLTLAQFERYVRSGEVHYYIASTGGGGPMGAGGAAAITSWVEKHFTAQTVGGETVYDLSGAASSA